MRGPLTAPSACLSRNFVAAALSALGLVACANQGLVAIDNSTDSDLLLRFERRMIWEVPAGGSGVGPTVPSTGAIIELMDT